MTSKKKVLVALSGGVDSSVAVVLLQRQGYEVGAAHLRHGVEKYLPENFSLSNFDKDENDAREIAKILGIPFYVLDVSETFKSITDNFASEYLRCRTPNPCLRCNRLIKFGALYDFAMEKGYDKLATGHYARIRPVSPEENGIFKASDPNKDQSYVLFDVKRDRLSNIVFPLGEYSKPEIRAMAAEFGLPSATKSDSQDICFLPDGNHARFLAPFKIDSAGNPFDTSGNIVTVEGKVVGKHDGLEKYTIGQRKGLGVAMNTRYFVVALRPETNEVVLGTHDQLGRRTLTASESNWLTDVPEYFCCQVKIRYRFTAVSATVHLLEGNRFEVQTDAPVYGVAPGQACVCYDGERLLGGGWID